MATRGRGPSYELRRLNKQVCAQKAAIKDLEGQVASKDETIKSYWDEILWCREKLRKVMGKPEPAGDSGV